MLEICNTPLFRDDEIRIYDGGANHHHDWWEQGEIEGLDVPEAQPGFDGRETCDTFHGDSTKHLVTWGGRSELPRDTLSRGAKLRFLSRHTSLYSFRIG